jgi:sialate O-acetylesterase
MNLTKTIFRVAGLISLSILPYLTFSQTKLPSFFGDGMVFQQKTDASIWGKDQPHTKISIKTTWGAKARTKSDASGKWKTTLKTPTAGGSYEVEIAGSQRVILKNVLVGEVWFCSGQSNMERTLEGKINEPVYGSNEAILNSKNSNIRFFTAERQMTIDPADDIKGVWQESSPKTAKNFSAVAYFFGKKIYDITNTPIGLISSSWGGTGSEAWTDSATLAKHIKTQSREEIQKLITENKMASTVLFNGMIHPFLDFDIAGVIWYQGENNKYAKRAEEYKKVFPAMIEAWREKWNQGKFPFYFVQIAPFQSDKGNSALVREAQLQTMQKLENTGMVVTLDVGDCGNIHPPQKKEVGDRLAYWALAKQYGMEGITFSGPIYKSHEVKNDSILVKFDYAEVGLTSFGQELTGFQIAGADEKFYPAKVEIQKAPNMLGSLKVYSPEVKKPVAVRYAYDHCIKGSIFNVAGLPASPFRTDTWEK